MVKSNRVDGDPIGSEAPRGKARFQRKSGRDPGFTPTEKLHKAKLMKQFCKNPEGSPNTEAYRNASCWDENGRLKP